EARNRDVSARLLESLHRTQARPAIVFTSSVQEEKDTPYARAKRWARLVLADWAMQHGTRCCGLIIPNVFGPFGEPYYHSVVTTFCHQLHTGEEPHILLDAEVAFIPMLDVIRELHALILHPVHDPERRIPAIRTLRVSTLLEMLRGFHESYSGRYEIPSLPTPFELALFNTYRSFIPLPSYPLPLQVHRDLRGSLAEVVRSGRGGQVFFSITRPGITRGNHFHLRKVERFCVLKGEALIRLRRIDQEEVVAIHVNGDQPSVVDMPVWYTHSITNTGDTDLLTLFWSSEFYDPEDADTWPSIV
ncbi:MAG TPA: NAD-dependent epimerase/dehydratase family protein, partial [Bacteroidales bacterium]|nr:NAD-dependent epimerase/dehydratase family protein [Bacteroidales bacterium]